MFRTGDLGCLLPDGRIALCEHAEPSPENLLDSSALQNYPFAAADR
jgi:hypothetical protein